MMKLMMMMMMMINPLLKLSDVFSFYAFKRLILFETKSVLA